MIDRSITRKYSFQKTYFVVGYQNYNLVQGYNLYAPTFEGVAAKNFDLQDVKIQGSDGWGTEAIFILDENGLITDQSYSWQCPDMTGEEDFCWVDDSTGAKATTLLVPGQGMYIYADTEGLCMVSSGSVNLGQYSKSLVMGYNITGNFSPVDIDLQDAKIVGSDGWGTEAIFVLDENGIITDQSYSWQCPDMTGEEEFCWVDDMTGVKAEDASLKAGEGLYLYADTEGLSLTLPNIIK